MLFDVLAYLKWYGARAGSVVQRLRRQVGGLGFDRLVGSRCMATGKWRTERDTINCIYLTKNDYIGDGRTEQHNTKLS